MTNKSKKGAGESDSEWIPGKIVSIFSNKLSQREKLEKRKSSFLIFQK
jgi:hypothetical protein